MSEGDVPPQGGKPGWAGLPSPRIGPWLRHLKKIAESHNLLPEFEVPCLYSYFEFFSSLIGFRFLNVYHLSLCRLLWRVPIMDL